MVKPTPEDKVRRLRLVKHALSRLLAWRAHDLAKHPDAERDLDHLRDAADALDAWAAPFLPPDLEQITGDPTGRDLYLAEDER